MIEDAVYRAPRDLEVTPPPPIKALVVGSCLVDEWAKQSGADYIPFAGVSRLPDPPADDYDFQIVQLNLRHFLPESAYFRLGDADDDAWYDLFANTADALDQNLRAAMRLNTERGLLTFVTNFMQPQANAMGRLLRRCHPSNPAHFIQRLNDHLADVIADDYPNAYVLDVDQIVATFGRRYFQDDVAWTWSHGGMLTDFDFERDQDRIEPTRPMTEFYPVRTREFIDAFWAEAVAMWRTVRAIDQVKLVIVDLDDTMWRGEAGESQSADALEGWPLGFIEALAYLKKRGVLLAIVSKNNPDRVREAWQHLSSERRLALEMGDFVSVKIGWHPKSDAIREILAETNLLPQSAVFIDDNPTNRAEVHSVYPEIRILGAEPYALRRILLWAPETQVASVTDESGRRTEMVQAQGERESVRATMTPEAFLESLEVVITQESAAHNMPRILELLNKTNQFNTTGRRWTADELDHFNGRICAFSVQDRFTGYGIVAVALVTHHNIIQQMVMSCRVFGLGVEQHILKGLRGCHALFEPTEHNHICRAVIEAFN